MNRTVVSVYHYVDEKVLNNLRTSTKESDKVILEQIKEGLERKMYTQIRNLAKTIALIDMANGHQDEHYESVNRAIKDLELVLERY